MVLPAITAEFSRRKNGLSKNGSRKKKAKEKVTKRKLAKEKLVKGKLGRIGCQCSSFLVKES